jgi:hypothetical protein
MFRLGVACFKSRSSFSPPFGLKGRFSSAEINQRFNFLMICCCKFWEFVSCKSKGTPILRNLNLFKDLQWCQLGEAFLCMFRLGVACFKSRSSFSPPFGLKSRFRSTEISQRFNFLMTCCCKFWENVSCQFKGQLISKCSFGVFKLTKKPTKF